MIFLVLLVTNKCILNGYVIQIDDWSVGWTEKLNVEIIGVSKDSIKTHQNFIEKHKLKIKLGSDLEGKVIEKFGVWVEKKMYGRIYMGIERSSFLISDKGRIENIWRKVKVKGHAKEVYERISC